MKTLVGIFLVVLLALASPVQAQNWRLKEEGSEVGRVRELNVVGAGATATATGGVGTLTISDDIDLIAGDTVDDDDLDVAAGGTGVSTHTDGGVLIGKGTGDVEAMAVLANSEMIVGDGTTNPVPESGATLRTSIGVAIGSDVQGWDADLDDLADGSLTGSKVSAASATAVGVAELATAAETTTGTDTARVVTPDGLAGSDYGKRVVELLVFDGTTDTATGNDAGGVMFRVPSVMDGYNLVEVAANVHTAGTTNTTDVQVRNLTQTQDMLSTVITIDSGETDTLTAAAAAVIDTLTDDVATGDSIRIDVDAVSTTAAKGLLVELTFQEP